ncbi:MAG: leucyl/phenylalanyl-tRNA--protein transferase, partial [Flavobacteriales bacterium]|nr:leucyl/phenylalanyl-tRNA--protein transferase [Flavobacteriales bacterium]
MASKETDFPPVEMADEDGFLAWGGDLGRDRLLQAYRSGIFPWFNPGEPILWWAPDPRFVLFPDELKVSDSMRRLLQKAPWRVTLDNCFADVIRACKKVKRAGQKGTWITDEMEAAYTQLHREGWAHSVEVWEEEELIGGLYGVSLGNMFFGESMFALRSNASKYGFITLVAVLKEKGFTLIDCQVPTEHLASLGARPIARKEFMGLL